MRAIGESPGLVDRDVVINFKIDGVHVRFDINLAVADEQKLIIQLRAAELCGCHTKTI